MNQLLTSTLNQMLVLFLLILVGYILAKAKVLKVSCTDTLAKLENNFFIPALILSTFITNFTPDKISQSWKILLFSIIIEIIVLPIALFLPKLLSKDNFVRNISTYGFCFSNFGFMGNAIVVALFPDIFLEYVIFTLPLWSLIYIWGAPTLLIPKDQSPKRNFYAKIKPFINPMFISIFLGIILGLTKCPIPDFINTAIDYGKDCMSPIAMILTGITIAGIDIKKTLKTPSVYTASVIRLVLFPLLFIVLCLIINLKSIVPQEYIICALCSLSMPLGLNSIVVPSAYGIDTSVPAGMCLISHTLSIATIPLVFSLLTYII